VSLIAQHTKDAFRIFMIDRLAKHLPVADHKAVRSDNNPLRFPGKCLFCFTLSQILCNVRRTEIGWII
jgi:hypothetical protein